MNEDERTEEDASQRLEAAVPTITEVLRIFRTPSCSVGVLSKNRTIFTQGFGCFDKESRVPNQETIYNIGSCTKAFTTTALALLSQQGRIQLNTPVSEYLCTFDTPYNPEVGRKATLEDFLTHSTGLAPLVFAVLGRNYATLVQKQDVVHICSHLACVAELRSEWQYSNWSYALAAHLVDKQSGSSWTESVNDILHELGLCRTYTGPFMDDNTAKSCIVLSDGSFVESAPPSLQGGDAFDGSGAIRSCVKDMLRWSKALIEASKLSAPIVESGFEAVSPTSPESSEYLSRRDLLKALRVIQQPLFPIGSDPRQSYGLGLFNFCMPTEAINSVTNSPKVMKSYLLGAESPSRAVIGHTGDLGSFTRAYWLFPETDSAVVVMTNGSSIDGDSANIVAQVITQALFALKPEIDFIRIAEQATRAAEEIWQSTIRNWRSNRATNTTHKDLNAYIGSYTSTDLRITLHISLSAANELSGLQDLEIVVNNLHEQKHTLYHYHYDTWTFLPRTRDECVAKGLGIYISSWQAFNFVFTRYGLKRFRGLEWSMDLDPRASLQVFSRIGP